MGDPAECKPQKRVRVGSDGTPLLKKILAKQPRSGSFAPDFAGTTDESKEAPE